MKRPSPLAAANTQSGIGWSQGTTTAACGQQLGTSSRTEALAWSPRSMSADALGAFALAIIATGGLPTYMAYVGMKPDLDFAHRNARRNMGSHRGIADRVSPVDETLLAHLRDPRKPSWPFR